MRAPLFGRNALKIGTAAALLASCGSPQTPTVSGVTAGGDRDVLPYHKTFRYTGKKQSFVVPAGVTRLTVVSLGAAGGGSLGGRGGRVFAQFPVYGGEHLAVYVGGTASGLSGAYNGGGPGLYGSEGPSYGGGGGGGSSYIKPSARKYVSWRGWKTATGNGLAVFSW